jgi:hypothetical protein
LEQGWFERLTAIMTAMAAGDTDALALLYVEYGDPIRGVVRQELARLGVTHLDGAEIDGLALDVCSDLFRRAAAWDPARNTLPWTWARMRVRAIVGRSIGQFADPLPEGGPAEAPAPVAAEPAGNDDENVLVTLDRLAGLRGELRLLHEALDRVSRPAQQELLFEVRMQATQGDPSPAVTVARAYGLRPDAVRQTCKRVVDRVRDLSATDPYFASLADLHLLRKAS